MEKLDAALEEWLIREVVPTIDLLDRGAMAIYSPEEVRKRLHDHVEALRRGADLPERDRSDQY